MLLISSVRLCLFFLSILLASCQSFSPDSFVAIPTGLRPHFGNCWQPSGSIHFTLYKTQRPVLSANADWVHDEFGAWRWELYDLLGRTLFSGQLANKKMTVRSSTGVPFEALSLDSDGFLIYDGSPLALKWKEVNCFLNEQLPEEWLDRGQAVVSNSSRKYHLNFVDHERRIDVDVSPQKICGVLRTRFLLLFTRERASWCFFKNPQHATLNFENLFQMEWTHPEEGGEL